MNKDGCMMDIKAEIEDLMPKSKVFKEDRMKILPTYNLIIF